MLNLKPLIHRILEDYSLPWHGTHGVDHWARVLENRTRLAKETKANIEVVQLFAIFHDSCRVNEDADWGHGERGGNLALTLRDDGRASFDIVPDFVHGEWGIDLGG